MSSQFLEKNTRIWCGVCKWIVAIGVIAFGIIFWTSGAHETAMDRFWGVLPDNVQAVTQPAPVKSALIYGLIAGSFLLRLIMGAAMFRLFHVFQTEEVFGRKALSTLRILGLTILITALYSLILPTLVPLAMTMDNPPGYRTLSVAISSSAFTLAITGIMVMIVGQVMMMAARAVDENRQFV